MTEEGKEAVGCTLYALRHTPSEYFTLVFLRSRVLALVRSRDPAVAYIRSGAEIPSTARPLAITCREALASANRARMMCSGSPST